MGLKVILFAMRFVLLSVRLQSFTFVSIEFYMWWSVGLMLLCLQWVCICWVEVINTYTKMPMRVKYVHRDSSTFSTNIRTKCQKAYLRTCAPSAF